MTSEQLDFSSQNPTHFGQLTTKLLSLDVSLEVIGHERVPLHIVCLRLNVDVNVLDGQVYFFERAFVLLLIIQRHACLVVSLCDVPRQPLNQVYTLLVHGYVEAFIESGLRLSILPREDQANTTHEGGAPLDELARPRLLLTVNAIEERLVHRRQALSEPVQF